METILFAIIIGIISAIFSKVKSNQSQSKKKPFSMNGMKEIRTNFDELTNNEPKETSPIKAVPKAETPQNKLKNLEEEYLQARKESEISRKRVAQARKQNEVAKELENKVKREESETLLSEYPDAKTLVNGIVWSEILGEPRSKKPYFAKRG